MGIAARALLQSLELQFIGKAPMELENRLKSTQHPQEYKSMSVIDLQMYAPYYELKILLQLENMSNDVDNLHLPLMPERIGRTHITILSVVSLESTTHSLDVNTSVLRCELGVFHTEVNFGLEFFICAE